MSIPAKFKKNNEIRDLIEMMEAKFSIDQDSQLPSAKDSAELKARFASGLGRGRSKKNALQAQPLKNIDQNMEVDEIQIVEEFKEPTEVKRKRKYNEIS